MPLRSRDPAPSRRLSKLPITGSSGSPGQGTSDGQYSMTAPGVAVRITRNMASIETCRCAVNERLRKRNYTTESGFMTTVLGLPEGRRQWVTDQSERRVLQQHVAVGAWKVTTSTEEAQVDTFTRDPNRRLPTTQSFLRIILMKNGISSPTEETLIVKYKGWNTKEEAVSAEGNLVSSDTTTKSFVEAARSDFKRRFPQAQLGDAFTDVFLGSNIRGAVLGNSSILGPVSRRHSETNIGGLV